MGDDRKLVKPSGMLDSGGFATDWTVRNGGGLRGRAGWQLNCWYPDMLTVLALSGFALGGLALLAPRLRGNMLGSLGGLAALAIAVGLASLFSPSGEAVVETTNWIHGLGVSLAFRMDGLAFFFAMLITVVGAAVLFYAGGYTRHWRSGRRLFFALLFFFMASMLGLVLADNLFLLYVFWELTTVASFLLIGFKQEKPAAREAAFAALLVTGAGGLALLAGLFLLGSYAGTFSLVEIVRMGAIQDPLVANGAVALIGLGCLIKSGQFPFHFWLPKAMEAPTPASAYLHAATMVKAGLYLLARLSPALSEAALWSPLLATTAIATGCVAAWGMLSESDMKACLAYSTIGALAVGLACLAAGGDKAMEVFAVFLLAHAGYKASLFMVAGGVEEATGTRDLRRLSGYGRLLPGLAFAGVGGAIAMAEIGPELSYIAKESALTLFHQESGWWGVGAFGGLAVAFVTLSVVIGYRVFFGDRSDLDRKVESPPSSLWLTAAALGWAGVGFSLWPKWTSHWLVTPVVDATRLEAGKEVHLSLWHGFTWEFAVTIGTVVLGLLLGSFWSPVRSLLATGNRWALLGTERLAVMVTNLWIRGSAWQRDLVEHGRLPLYLLAATFAVAALVLPWSFAAPLLPEDGGLSLQSGHWMDLFLMALAISGLVGAIFIRQRPALIVGLAVLGFAVAVVYVRFGAPDVAITHLLIETLMVALLASALRGLPEIKRLTSGWMTAVKVVVGASCGLAVTVGLLAARQASSGSRVSDFYLSTVYDEKGRSNVVAAIIADFRAIDTIGEITVLATAAIGLFHLARTGGRKTSEE